MTRYIDVKVYVNRLIQKTDEGRIKWEMKNPSTYIYETMIESTWVAIAIQRIISIKRPPKYDYIFQIEEKTVQETEVLYVVKAERGTSSNVYIELLEKLYSSVESSAQSRALYLLNRILED